MGCNAIAKSGEYPIDIILSHIDRISFDDFLVAVGGRIADWRSVELDIEGQPRSYGGLTPSECNSLEKLALSWVTGGLPQTTPLSLFDGDPASATLKELSLSSISVDFVGMRLSNLSKLVLEDVPHLTMEDILLVLESSPLLVELELRELRQLRVTNPIGGGPIHLGSLTTCIFALPIPVTHFLLSTIHTPSLRHANISCDPDGSGRASSLFSPSIAAFAPTLRRLISPTKYIETEFGPFVASISFGGLGVTMASSIDVCQRLRDVLDSLMSYPGVNRAGLKAHLHFLCFEPDLETLQIFDWHPMVEELAVSNVFWKDLDPMRGLAALGTQIRNGPGSWLFPELEVLKYDVDNGFYAPLEMALEGRYCEVPTIEGTSTTTHQHPLLLK
ncbi:hypothetical protein FRC05_007111 [Tulasnella sp. 425]|nr:hypothetical protein FRC05_007111 [Tulasnella sp. 425]